MENFDDRLIAKAIMLTLVFGIITSWILFKIFKKMIRLDYSGFIEFVESLKWRRKNNEIQSSLAEKVWDSESAEKWNEEFRKKPDIPVLHREISTRDIAWVDDEGFCIFYACEGRTYIKNNYEGWHVLAAEEAEKVQKPHHFEGVRLATDEETRELTLEFIELRADCINTDGRPYPSPLSSLAALHACEERAEKQAAITLEQFRNHRRH